MDDVDLYLNNYGFSHSVGLLMKACFGEIDRVIKACFVLFCSIDFRIWIRA